ncbi:hypothetical protein [Veillonella sp. T11011-6]|uniref:hypothetical protein n=1 Tax=Veillonella sp. T11011-6 TaxID=2027459 RepID=UPI000CF3EFC5|nr:hypothetical protein [Veillonella sp. T11011-6]MDU6061522.1 hypothetical protein [Veillonella sp.]PQL10940.1 hypothetical protein VRHSUH10_00865 [Veillonella sp. T11011-6]
MAKKIKFPLEFSNGIKVRTLEELQQYADVKSILRYYHNEKLKIWLEARDYNDIVSQIISIDTNDTSYVNKLCNILGIEYEDLDVEVYEIQKNEEKLNRLRCLTSDENILSRVENIVFNQQELDDLVTQMPELIYLCANENQIYTINKKLKNIRYIGLFGKPSIQVEAENMRELFDLGIKFKDIVLPAYLQKSLRPDVEYKGDNFTSNKENRQNKSNNEKRGLFETLNSLGYKVKFKDYDLK